MFYCDRCTALSAPPFLHDSVWLHNAVSNVRFLLGLLLIIFFPLPISSSDSILLAIKLLGTRKYRLWWEIHSPSASTASCNVRWRGGRDDEDFLWCAFNIYISVCVPMMHHWFVKRPKDESQMCQLQRSYSHKTNIESRYASAAWATVGARSGAEMFARHHFCLPQSKFCTDVFRWRCGDELFHRPQLSTDKLHKAQTCFGWTASALQVFH